MSTKKTEIAEYQTLTSTEQRARWLIAKGIKARIVIHRESGKAHWAAFAGGIELSGEYESEETAVSGATDQLESKILWTWATDSPVWLKPRRQLWFLTKGHNGRIRESKNGRIITYRNAEAAQKAADKLNS